MARTPKPPSNQSPKREKDQVLPSGRVASPPRSRWRKTLGLIPAAIIGLLLLWSLLFLFLAPKLPDTNELVAEARQAEITLLAADGEVLAVRGVSGRPYVTLDAIAPAVVEAVLATEDRRFYSHFGLDLAGLGRAFLANLSAGAYVAGGSTLTQQLAKNLYLTPERSIRRKLNELILALWLEARLTKDQILEVYLNRVYLGSGAYGVEAAARRYFGKDAGDLTLSESAMLAGLLKAPSYYAPTADLARARGRAATVLGLMADAGYLTPDEAAAARAHPAALVPTSAPFAADFTDWVLDDLGERLGKPATDRVVRTTLDRRLQTAAETAVAAGLQGHPGIDAAMVVLDRSGAVRAMVGGLNGGKGGGMNRAVAARRQPGSAFKPFVYATALAEGRSPGDRISDAPLTVGGWTPRNAGNKSYGQVTLETAFAYSLNTVAVRLIEAVGPKAVAATARRLGIESALRPVPSLALGTSEVTPLELTAAYLPFATQGVRRPPFGVERVSDAAAGLLYARVPVEAPVLDPPVAAGMLDLLCAAVARGTGQRAQIKGREVCGKTGTTQDNRDAWFVGFTGDFVAGVWVGRDDAAPMQGVNGAGVPARIWAAALAASPRDPRVAELRPTIRPEDGNREAIGDGTYALHSLARWWRRTFGGG